MAISNMKIYKKNYKQKTHLSIQTRNKLSLFFPGTYAELLLRLRTLKPRIRCLKCIKLTKSFRNT